MNAQDNLKAIENELYYTFYDGQLSGVGRYDENYEGLVFEGVSVTEEDGKIVVTVDLEEEMSAEGVYFLLDGGNLTLEDLQDYDAEQVAENVLDVYDPLEENAVIGRNRPSDVTTVADLVTKVRELVGSDDYDIRYDLTRFIDADVVSDYYEHRREELQD